MASRARGLALVLTSLVVGLAGPVVAASAAPPSGTVAAGDVAYVVMDLPVPVANCELLAAVPGQSERTLNQTLAVGNRIEWMWVVPADAASALWTVTARCQGSTLTTQLAVQSSGGSRSVLAGDVQVVTSLGALPTPSALLTQLAAPLAQAWWAGHGQTILNSFQQGSAAGQCTAYAARRRPDVIARVDTWSRTQALRSGQPGLAVDWTARSWARDALAAGLTVSHSPAPNAVMVFGAGADGAGRSGHVAVVDRVAGDGSFTISEMHAPRLGRITIRRFSARGARAVRRDPRVSFILP